MSNETSNLSKIINRSSFRSFYKNYRPMKRAPFVKKESGETFVKLVFPDYSLLKGSKEIIATSAVPKDKDSSYLMVGFSSKLGELSNAELQKQLDSLQVCQLESGSFKLCKQGQGDWETVELEL